MSSLMAEVQRVNVGSAAVLLGVKEHRVRTLLTAPRTKEDGSYNPHLRGEKNAWHKWEVEVDSIREYKRKRRAPGRPPQRHEE